MQAHLQQTLRRVHGDIRHLETSKPTNFNRAHVHGDIRHLEMSLNNVAVCMHVHGDIRHLEMGFGC